MKIGFDLDGTLDRPILRDLALALLTSGHEVHVITGVFTEAGEWNQPTAKYEKMKRLGIPFGVPQSLFAYETLVPRAILHVLVAAPETFDRDYRLADLGLRKGALCEELGITLFIDDSAIYAEMIPKMSGGTTVLQVR